jgi:type VI secretion system FHA domain protein
MFSDRGAMKITLTVNQVAGTRPAQPMTVTFDEEGGSIGRRDVNDWILPDPERFISGRHAQIDFSNDVFYITDLSSNGVFINGSTEPLGKNNRAALEDGDNINIGDYQIDVVIEKPVIQTLQSENFEGFDDPFARMVDEQAGKNIESSFLPPLEPAEAEPRIEEEYSLDEPETPDLETDELALEQSALGQGSQDDHLSDLNAVFNQGAPIPEDWYQEDEKQDKQSEPPIIPPLEPTPPSLDELSSAETPAPAQPQIIPDDQSLIEPDAQPIIDQQAISIPSQPIERELPPPAPPPRPAEQTAPYQSRPADEANLRRVLAESMEIPEASLADLPMQALLQNLGKILRTSVNGTMSMLRVRAQMKGEFRMSQTMIQPVENNPLKFSINIEEAMRHILNPKPSSGYLSPVTAFEEAHEDIEAHMMAVMVGMQAALKAVLQRFEPDMLEQRLGQQALLEKLPLYRHAKTWELFTELYSQIANEAEDDFHQLFGRAFSHAYEEQIRRLESLKQTTSDSTD